MEPNDGVGRMSVRYKLLLYITTAALSIVIFASLVELGLINSTLRTWPIRLTDLPNTLDDHEAQVSGYAMVTSDHVDARYAILPIDHGNAQEGTYRNRYWVNDRYYQTGGPVFVYDTGETNASLNVERFLLRDSSFMVELLAEFHGVGILWEHRYYGESWPITPTNNTPADTFRFLTLNQSLADLPYFANNFSLDTFPNANLRPSMTPWIIVGCSYSGMRAALSRYLYPETFYASYAGSAPSRFQVAVGEYYEALHLALVESGYKNCSKDLHAIMRYIDAQLDIPLNTSAVKMQYLGAGAEYNSNEDFALALASLYDAVQGFGLHKGELSVSSLCNFLEWDSVRKQSANEDGLVVRYGVRHMSDKLASWDRVVSHINKRFNSSCANHT